MNLTSSTVWVWISDLGVKKSSITAIAYVIHTAYVFPVENSFWNAESTLVQYLLIFNLFWEKEQI